MDILITIVLTSLVWAVIARQCYRYNVQKQIAIALGIRWDFEDQTKAEFQVRELKKHLARTKNFDGLYWSHRIPSKYQPYYSWYTKTREVDEFVQAAHLVNRKVALVHNGEIEIIV